jgi:hypothetical protein
MIRKSAWALCALVGVAACEEEPQETHTYGAVRDAQQVATAAPPPEGPGSTGTPCPDASETPDGRLSCTFADGRKFDGQVQGGKANGPGRMWFPNGDRYSGNFYDGLFGGSGTYWYASGARYDGQFANGLRNGSGTTVWPNGSRYAGNYVHNKPNGYGTVTTANGTRSGQWRDGCLDSARVAIDATLAECGYD